MTPKLAERFAVRLAASGIAAGAIASRHIATLCGFPNAIGLDMGGTSHRHLARLRRRGAGHEGVVRRVRLPDLLPVDRGADDRRRRRLASPGSTRPARCATARSRREPIPGPACYGRGNDRPTNTDANLVLGRLGDGADRRRDDARPRRRRAGDPRARRRAARARSRRGRGRDHPGREREHGRRRAADLDPARLRPARVRLVVFGGAGPLHGAALAQELSIPTVLVPPNPGITSALGCLLVDVRHDLSTMFLAHVDTVDQEALEAEFDAARGRGARAARGTRAFPRSRCGSSASSTCATSASGGR